VTAPMLMQVFFHPDYNATGLNFETIRKATPIAQSLIDNPIVGVEIVAPAVASRDELESVHAAEYVDAVRTGDPLGLAGSNGIGWDDRLFASAGASTGGVRDAVLAALSSGGVAGSLSSGLHHARRGRGSGFCTFNGLVVGARAALDAGATRMLVLDLDAHCGGGTASLIDGVPGIEQVDVSVNSFDRYESSAQTRLTLSGGDEYLAVVERELDRIDSPETIDLVIYNAGMDPHEHAGGVGGIDADVIAARERMVFTWTSEHRIPTAWVLAGGYLSPRLDMSQLVDLHRLTIEVGVQNCLH
jgi:acetoin utilization deacetylase AcuC-like enzyme